MTLVEAGTGISYTSEKQQYTKYAVISFTTDSMHW